MTRRVLLASLNAGAATTRCATRSPRALARVDPEQQQLEPRGVELRRSGHRLRSTRCACASSPGSRGRSFELSSQPWAMRTAMVAQPAAARRGTGAAPRRSASTCSSPPTRCRAIMLGARPARARRSPSPLVIAVPDYGVPATGYYPPLPEFRPDSLVVMEESTLEHYRSLGVPEDRLHLSGFLTREPFVRVGARLRAEGRDTARAALRAEVAAAHPEFAALRARAPHPALPRRLGLDVQDRAGAAAACSPTPRCARRQRGGRRRSRPRPSRPGSARGLRDGRARLRLRRARGARRADGAGRRAGARQPRPGHASGTARGRARPAAPLPLHPRERAAHVGYIEGQRLGVYAPARRGDAPERIRELLGLEAASEPLARARDGFRERARLLRSRSVERALQLPRFLERMMDDPAGHPRR